MPNPELTRMRHKACTDRSVLDALLDEALIGHFALVIDERPVVLPTAIARDGDQVLLHGSTGSPWLRALANGVETCLAVTAVDALVIARSGFESSMNFRSAVLFGRCRVIDGGQHRRALDILTEALLPGRVAEVRLATAKELAATIVLALPIEQWSLKVSDDWPDDGPEDVAGPAWAGLIPVTGHRGTPASAPDLRTGIPIPESVRRLVSPAPAAPAAG